MPECLKCPNFLIVYLFEVWLTHAVTIPCRLNSDGCRLFNVIKIRHNFGGMQLDEFLFHIHQLHQSFRILFQAITFKEQKQF